MSKPVLRFVVSAADDRRSGEWRVFTGSKRPTDDVYVAPRQDAGRFKISLHKDGHCQHGPTSVVRSGLRRDDRHALATWTATPELAPGLRLGYSIRFFDSELRSRPAVGDRTLAVPGPGKGGTLVVAILIWDGKTSAESMAQALVGFHEIGRLPTRSGGSVIVGGISATVKDDWMQQFRAEVLGMSHLWEVDQVAAADAEIVYAYGQSPDGSHWAAELAADTTQLPQGFPALDPTVGQIRSLSEYSGALPPFPVCAILRVNRRREVAVFVDARARCDHDHLGSDVQRLSIAFAAGDIERHWDRLDDETWVTAITTRSEAERLGRGIHTSIAP